MGYKYAVSWVMTGTTVVDAKDVATAKTKVDHVMSSAELADDCTSVEIEHVEEVKP